MSLLDLISLIIAIWGAGLSSYLALRELRRERRQVRVYLDHIEWVERFQMLVVNVGHRPVTIVEVALRPIYPEETSGEFPIYPEAPEGFALPKLPALLNDGESLTLPMPEQVGSIVYVDGARFEAYALDAEGNEHVTSRVRHYDAKYGRYYP